MLMARRSLLAGLGLALAAPFIVRAPSLMHLSKRLKAPPKPEPSAPEPLSHRIQIRSINFVNHPASYTMQMQAFDGARWHDIGPPQLGPGPYKLVLGGQGSGTFKQYGLRT